MKRSTRPRDTPIDWTQVRERVDRARAATEWTERPDAEKTQAMLADRARALARPVATNDTGADAELIVFRVGERTYAIPLADALEVVRLREIAKVPGVPAPFVGITSLRGELIALVDVASLLGDESKDAEGPAPSPSKCLVIGAHGPELGIVADEVLGAEPIGDRAIAAPHPSAAATAGRPIVRALTASGRVLLDVGALLADERLTVDHRRAGEKSDEEQA